MSMFSGGEAIGEPEVGPNHTVQKIRCLLTDNIVELVCDVNGVVVCRSWKKCPKHYHSDLVMTCPEKTLHDGMKNWRVEKSQMKNKLGRYLLEWIKTRKED